MFSRFFLILFINISTAQTSQQDVLDLIAVQIGGGCKAPKISECSSSCYGISCGDSGSFAIVKNSVGNVYRMFADKQMNLKE